MGIDEDWAGFCSSVRAGVLASEVCSGEEDSAGLSFSSASICVSEALSDGFSDSTEAVGSARMSPLDSLSDEPSADTVLPAELSDFIGDAASHPTRHMMSNPQRIAENILFFIVVTVLHNTTIP